MSLMKRCLAFASLAALALCACGRAASPQQDTSPANPALSASASSSESIGREEPCSLLEPREVEAVLAAPLAVPPFLSRDSKPEDDGSACEYEDAALHSITVDVEWEQGAMAFKIFGAIQNTVGNQTNGLVRLSDGSELAGEWDEARVVGCCSFAALRGDQLVTVDVGGSKATIAEAAKLADAALKRLDHRVPIGGRQNVQAAVDFETAHRPKRRDPCSLASGADAEAVVGALTGPPESGDDRCVYEFAAAPGKLERTFVLKIRWTGGLHEFRDHNDAFGRFSKAFTHDAPLSAAGKEAIESAGVGDDVPANAAWETAHLDISGLSAVKNDVLVSIEPQGGTSDDAKKLMEKAMAGLGR
jgi:hypothetical protein